MDRHAPSHRISNKIENLRLPLCIGVMMIHCNIMSQSGPDDFSRSAKAIITCSSTYLPMLCVPMFFIISGYLASFKPINRSNYTEFLLKKCKSLLIPYLLWNIIAFVIRLLIKISPFGRFCATPYDFSQPFDLIFNIFIGPELISLWFVRNLILFNIFLPLLLLITRRYVWLSILSARLINESCDPLGGIFYFVIGIALGYHEEIINQCLNKSFAVGGIIVYVMSAIVLSLSIPMIPYEEWVSIPIILLGCASIFTLVPTERKDPSLGLTPSGIFFLYAFHGIISSYISKALTLSMPLSGYYGVIAYLVCCVLVISISILSWKILSRACPQLMYYLTGERTLNRLNPL